MSPTRCLSQSGLPGTSAEIASRRGRSGGEAVDSAMPPLGLLDTPDPLGPTLPPSGGGPVGTYGCFDGGSIIGIGGNPDGGHLVFCNGADGSAAGIPRQSMTAAEQDLAAPAHSNKSTTALVQVKTLSGNAVFGPEHLPLGSRVRDLLERIPPPAGCRAVLLLGTTLLCEEHLELSRLLPQMGDDGVGAITADVTVVWEPLLKIGDQVAVVRDFTSSTNYEATQLSAGQVGKVLKIHSDPGPVRGSKGARRATGDALVNFAGSNHWVSRQDLRKLKRL